MAMIYSVREMSLGGKGIGRFRYVGLSDESENAVDELCDCENGHATRDEAEKCPQAKARLDKLFHRDLDSLTENVDRKRAELESAKKELWEKKREMQRDGRGDELE